MDEHVIPGLYTGCIPLQMEQMLSIKSNNPTALLHVVLKGVLSGFSRKLEISQYAPKEQLEVESTVSKVPGEATSHRDTGLSIFT